VGATGPGPQEAGLLVRVNQAGVITPRWATRTNVAVSEPGKQAAAPSLAQQAYYLPGLCVMGMPASWVDPRELVSIATWA